MAMTTQTPAAPEVQSVRLGQSPVKRRKKAIWEWRIVQRAIWDAFLKLNPRKMMGNPVMFVVEIGSVITTALLFKGGAAFNALAMVHGCICKFCGSHGGRSWQGAGRHPSQSAFRNYS